MEDLRFLGYQRGMIWLWVAIAVVMDGTAGLTGALLPERWLERYRAPMLGFAAGALLASGLVEILPDAVARGGAGTVAWVLGAMAVLGGVEWVSRRRGHHRDRPVVPMALLASDALHNISDGMAIAAAFLVSPRLGVMTSAAVIVHEVPEEIADYALLRIAGMTKRRALAALAVVQLTAGIGAAGTLLASSQIARTEGIILPIACGTFIYIAIVNLIPELVRARERSAILPFLIAVVVVIGMP